MHFLYPFSFNSLTGHVNEVEQDTIDDVVGCVEVAILTEYGFRPEVPTYGVPDPVFQLQPVDLETILQAVEGFEPRTALLLAQASDIRDKLIAKIDNIISMRTVS